MTSDIAALKKEVALLRQEVEEKNKNIEDMKGQLALAQRSEGEIYRFVEPTLAGMRSVYDKTSRVPILRHFLRFGVAVADVGMKATPFRNCAGLNEKIGKAAPYLDEQVISPQVLAWRATVKALCGPPIEAASLTVEPYVAAARPYVERGVVVVGPYVGAVTRVAQSIVLRAVAIARPLIIKFEEVVAEVAEELDETVADQLDHLDANKVYSDLQRGAEAATAFAKEHRGDVEALASQAAAFAKEHQGDVEALASQVAGAARNVADGATGLPLKA